MFHKKGRVFYAAFAAILGIVLVTTSNYIVRSECVEYTKPSPFKFNRPHAPIEDIPGMLSAPVSSGDLDPMFGVNGRQTIDFSSNDYANAVVLQADGKIVTAGTVRVGGSLNNNYDFAVFRYNTDGSLDTSFDTDGKVATPISTEFNNADIAYAAAIQTDGKIIAAGTTSGPGDGRAALVRYNTDGSLDTSFGGGGKVITAGYLAISEIALQSDGKIVAADGSFKIARYNSNGSLDATFGTGGIVTTDFGVGIQRASSIAVQTDGKIVAAGDSGFCDDDDNCFFDFALARYNTDGSLDTSFDTDGKLTTTFGGDFESASSIAVQTDGKIVAGGYAQGVAGFAVARYNGDGSLDLSFDGDGKVTTNVGGYSYQSSVVLQADAKIVVSGSSYIGASYDFSLVRLNADGSLDTSFDTDGKLTTDFGDADEAYDVAIQADGKIVAAGLSGNTSTSIYDFALSRYNIDGSLDSGFDSDGKVTTSLIAVSSAANAIALDERLGFTPRIFVAGYSGNGANEDFALAIYGGGGSYVGKTITPVGNSDDRANAVGIDPSGRAIAAGYSDNGSDTDFPLVRFHGNNSIDTSFDGDGKLTTDFGGNNDEATALVVLPDYRIVVVGHTSINGVATLALARYNHDGSLDTSFGTGGKVIVQAIRNARAMAIQPDGKIIAAGNAPDTSPPFGDNFALARLHPDGSLDTSFDGDGIAVTGFDFGSQINSVALLPYGKIVAAGFTQNSTATVTEFALARYNSNGSLDTTFDADGKVTTSFDTPFSAANAVRVQRNGKIIAVGASWNNSSSRDFALARFNPNGSLDITFDTDGKQTTDFFGGNDDAFAAAIQRGGKIVAAGSAHHGAKHDFAAARYIGDVTATNVSHDYDGDGLADISVFRPSNAVWYLDRSTEGFTATQFGLSTDKITPADFDGDGRTDLAVYRDGTWYLRTRFFAISEPIQFGLPDDIPVAADYTGDGRAELAIYRGGQWWMLNRRFNFIEVIQFGLPTDKPVPADYDGDGRVDQAIYRNGEWHLNQSTLGYTVVPFGIATDRPVAADYDGDGKADPAVYRDGIWYLLRSTEGFAAIQFGLPTDVPIPADYDGDGKTDVAVFRDGTWYVLRSTEGISIRQFGLTGDRPVSSAFLY